jgi:hypothetical protein
MGVLCPFVQAKKQGKGQAENNSTLLSLKLRKGNFKK